MKYLKCFNCPVKLEGHVSISPLLVPLLLSFNYNYSVVSIVTFRLVFMSFQSYLTLSIFIILKINISVKYILSIWLLATAFF